MSSWRLILSSPASGAGNMALDEAILDGIVGPGQPPTLRLYAWQPACLSLGMAQPAEEVNRSGLVARGWELVRRPTGGRAILHAEELTYSVVAGVERAEVSGGVLESYRRISRALVAGLQVLGLAVEVRAEEPARETGEADPVCFQVPSAYEILAAGRKLVGSAQVRRLRAVLQHGSIPLAGDLGAICEALKYPDEAARAHAQGRVRARAATVSALLRRRVAWREAAEALIEGFRSALGVEFERSEPTAEELQRADELRARKYESPAWTDRR
jgi:lipoate-protein ligase A